MKTGIIFYVSIMVLCIGFFQENISRNIDEPIYIGWVQDYCGPESLSVPVDLTLDSKGNIYLSAFTYNSAADYGFVTLKYNPEGKDDWIVKYNGESDSTDKPVGMAIDSHDNIYIAGYSYFDDCNFDYFIIKYNSNGNIEWSARNDDTSHRIDKITALAIDKHDNLYVTGNTQEMDSSFSILTIKYDAEGQIQWAVSEKNSYRLVASQVRIAVDNSGNVCITDEGYYNKYPSILIKYNSEGDKMWTKTSGARNPYIAIDENDFIYVAATANSTFRMAKYDRQGENVWTTYFPAHPMGLYHLTDIAIFDQNNIYASGNELIPASGLSDDGFLIKYDRFGNQQWIRYNASSERDGINEIVIDHNNNIYATGFGRNSLAYYAFWTAKFDSAGYLKWSAKYADPSCNKNIATNIACDQEGNVFVTGYKTDDNKSIITTIKYSSTPTSVNDSKNKAADYVLDQNYPNPFNPSTTIRFALLRQDFVSLHIIDLLGRRVRTLVENELAVGEHSVVWDGRDEKGIEMPAGIYFARLRAGDEMRTIKLLLVR